MKVVVQRVGSASVTVGGECVAAIERGLLVLWGIEEGDTWVEADYLVNKVLKLRLWPDSSAAEDESRSTGQRVHPTRSTSTDDAVENDASSTPTRTWAKGVTDLGYEILVVSQFTLMGVCKKGNKPDFRAAMASDQASPFFSAIVDKIGSLYDPGKVKKGAFGHFMQVSLVNDGPVTMVLEQRPASA